MRSSPDITWRYTFVLAEGCDRIIVLDADGEAVDPLALLTSRTSENTAVVIDGFPSGPIRSDLSTFSVERLSLGSGMLKVWTVTSEMLVAALHAATGP